MNTLDAFLDQFKDMQMLTGGMIYVLWMLFREESNDTPEQAREINRQEAGGSSFVRRLLNQ